MQSGSLSFTTCVRLLVRFHLILNLQHFIEFRMDDQRSQRDRFIRIGLGKLTVGGAVLAHAIQNRHVTRWAFGEFALGGAMIASGLIHLSVAWDIDPAANDPPPPNGRVANGGVFRAGIPLAENERGDPDLAGEGLILHQNFPPIAHGKRDVGEAKLHDVGEARPANFAARESRAGSGGLLRREPVQQGIVNQEDQEIGDNNEFDPENALEEVVQAANALEEVGRADDEESDQPDNVGELGQDTDESESANVVNESGLSKNVGEEEPTNEVNVAGQASNIDEVNMADSLEDIAECADKDDSTHECESDIEFPRSSVGLSLDIPSIKFIDSSESDCESSY
ncbi:hypothetical protein JTE90_011084 [Oedothorax gibbosus]|uniref:Uncharacterized protein n=1 Tax=Oedothorax gibbosus TaxID=931172 RepID=A0AAV6UMD3_9ARAC|nr:hypothetical protein JTE90_011084 [Oedothorax gibbosus]